MEHAILGPEIALIQCALHIAMHARAVGRVDPIEERGQARRDIGARANQQAKPGRPVAPVALDLPLPYACVDTFLCDVKPVVGLLEMAFEPERMRQRLLAAVAQQAYDEGHAGEDGKVQHVRHACHRQRPSRLEEGQRADEHRQDRGCQPWTQSADDRRCNHGQRKRQQDRLLMEPWVEHPPDESHQDGRRHGHRIADSLRHGSTGSERDSHLRQLLCTLCSTRPGEAGDPFARGAWMTAKRRAAAVPRSRRAPSDSPLNSSTPTGGAPALEDDVNASIAGLLLDLAALQDGPRALAYKRAAHAVLGLAQPLSALRNGPKLPKIPYVGPSSERVILEYLEAGRSPTVERAIHESGRAEAIATRRSLRGDFISQATAEAVLAAPAHGLVALADYRGDFQMHSTWSDGGQTLERIVEASLALEQTCAGVTDHGYGLPIASGMSMEAASRQHAAIDELNGQRRGQFRLFKGIEANIRADGRIDMEPHELRRFEFVVASPHSALRSRADQTARMVAAVSHPWVDILGHPRGRRYDVRPGVSADWHEVFSAAAERRVAIELDGYPDRQDIDWTLAAAALEAGCLFALDSDAHATEELLFSRMAVAHARLAGLTPERVINCWSDQQLQEWMNRPEREG